MEMVLRALAMYLILLVVFKIAGRRALLQMTSFDLILLLIISEATQQALLGNDFFGDRRDADDNDAGGGGYAFRIDEKIYGGRGISASMVARLYWSKMAFR